MDFITELLQQYGYPSLFLLGLVEFLGAPMATAPILLVVGASAAAGTINPVAAVVAVAAGGLLGESTWFSVARWRGKRLVDFACGLASNPNMCAIGFAERVRRSGGLLLIVAKFLPAGGSVPAFAAGLAGTAYRRFLVFDALALVVWSGFYIAAGGLFRDEIRALLEWAAAQAAWIVAILVLLFFAALSWRAIKVRRHRGLHAAHARMEARAARPSLV